jgi:hypothetical protein
MELLILVLKVAELKMSEAPTMRKRNRWTVLHPYVVVCYSVSLRGCEVFLLDQPV